MDVLLFYPAIFQKGGGDRVVLELAKRFNAPIYTSIYRRETSYNEFRELDVREIRSPLFEKPFFFLKKDFVSYALATAGMKFLNYKVREDYDVINAHANPSNWIRNRNERVCWYFYSPVRGAYDLYKQKVAHLPIHQRALKNAMFSWYKFWDRRLDPKIEKTVSVSPYVNVRDEKFISEYVRKPVEPIPPGVDHRKFRNEGYRKYFLYPSRIIPEKRFEYAIEAFREFCSKQKGFKLVIAGFLPYGDREQKYAQSLRELSKGLDVEFRFNPPDRELKSLYANSYAVLFSPMNEDWGLVPLEAMSSEKPCISVNEGGPTYTIHDGETGFLVNSPQHMAQKMLYLAQDPAENEKLGRAGRKRVLANYTWEIFLSKMEKALREVAKEKSK